MIDAVLLAGGNSVFELIAPPQVLGWDTKMAYCLDPDGLFVEVIQPGGPLTLDAMLATAVAP